MRFLRKIAQLHDLSKASPEFSLEMLRAYNRTRPKGPQVEICHAPFKSIYFGHYGNAIACCYNRTYILGKYPTDSIRGIWEGEKARKLRQLISENNLDHGCQGCKAQIVAGNYDATKAKQYDQLKLNRNGLPSVMEFELSNTCNLECQMCSGDFSALIRKNRENRPPLIEPYDDAFVDQLEEFIPHLEEAKFYGGEPFLVEIYYKIWERIIELNPKIRISVQTNATVLNSRVKHILERSEFHLNLSIDSFDRGNYERIRTNANYDRTMENLEWFYNYCKQRGTFFGISACAMTSNWRDLPEVVRRCNALDVPVYFHTVFFPTSEGFHSLTEEGLTEVLTELEPFQFTEDTPVRKKNSRHFQDMLKQLRYLLGQKRTTVPQGHAITSVDEFKNFVRKFIATYSGWSDAVKHERQKAI